MFDIILFEPEIPPNTGNIMRLAVNTGCRLHLVEPLGFSLGDKQLRRAGLDYREFADVKTWSSLPRALAQIAPSRVLAITTRGKTRYDEVQYEVGDALLFGPETRGLPQSLLDQMPAAQKLRIPMLAQSRSLNLANAVAVIVYEAWRQHAFGPPATEA